jgi:hypothetical protein
LAAAAAEFHLVWEAGGAGLAGVISIAARGAPRVDEGVCDSCML